MKTFINSLIKILIITATCSLIVLIIGLIARWQSVIQFSNGLFWAGVILGGIGVLASFGDKDMRFNLGVKYLQSPPQEKYTQLSGVEDTSARLKRSVNSNKQSFHLYILLFSSAALIILIGYLITVIF